MAKPKFMSDDYYSDDTWLTDRGPHHCRYCGYDIRTKNPDGTKIIILSREPEEVKLEHLPSIRWHKECADKDPQFKEAGKMVNDVLRKAQSLLLAD